MCVITSTARRAAVDQRTCLTDPDIWHDKPRWASDGKLLYVWRRDGSLFNVWALPFDEARGTVTGSPRQVTHFDSPAHHIWTNLDDIDPSVSRDRMILPMADEPWQHLAPRQRGQVIRRELSQSGSSPAIWRQPSLIIPSRQSTETVSISDPFRITCERTSDPLTSRRSSHPNRCDHNTHRARAPLCLESVNSSGAARVHRSSTVAAEPGWALAAKDTVGLLPWQDHPRKQVRRRSRPESPTRRRVGCWSPGARARNWSQEPEFKSGPGIRQPPHSGGRPLEFRPLVVGCSRQSSYQAKD